MNTTATTPVQDETSQITDEQMQKPLDAGLTTEGSTPTAQLLDCIAFMLITDNHILVEKRSENKRLLPGALAIPGGHVDAGESVESALVRELREELDITPQTHTYLCTLLHQADEYRRIHYFVVEQWAGEVHTLEAEELCWLPLDDLDTLDLEIDRTAIERYLAL